MNTDVFVIENFPIRPKEGRTYKFLKASVNTNNHTLHKYPAKFIPQFPKWALEYTRPKKVLDPFCGSGTTLVESGLFGCQSIGIDINPLAILISKAKTSILNHSLEEIEVILKRILDTAKLNVKKLTSDFEKNIGKECFGMHRTWSNWFRPDELSALISLREAICENIDNESLRVFSLASLSSIVKACSYLSEDQIKVRFNGGKELRKPFEYFPIVFLDQITKQIKLSKIYQDRGASFIINEGDASKIPHINSDIDLIVTSPPYINAVDYTMAHKYNLFVLNLINPSEFWTHSHKYIGVTERAVKASHLKECPTGLNREVNKEIKALWELGTATSKNRAYVISQYFHGMNNSFGEMNRVLRKGGKVVFVIGEINNICGRKIETAHILKNIAIKNQFKCELTFKHMINNRSSLRGNRGLGAGEIKNEVVFVFKK